MIVSTKKKNMIVDCGRVSLLYWVQLLRSMLYDIFIKDRDHSREEPNHFFKVGNERRGLS